MEKNVWEKFDEKNYKGDFIEPYGLNAELDTLAIKQFVEENFIEREEALQQLTNGILVHKQKLKEEVVEMLEGMKRKPKKYKRLATQNAIFEQGDYMWNQALEEAIKQLTN